MKSRAEIKAEMFKILSKYTGQSARQKTMTDSDKNKLEDLKSELDKMNDLEKFTETI